ncbi:MAG: helix-turn-helix transcriptional regulator [Dialister invisus]|jgi:transcriptional regulator with XRE-family HTH domain|uniref:Helix-turn-helix transcriptional regulator n=1 Tax=Dialister invisus TaxID=218538 RepID=A0A930B9M6_9FIRM|nr:helix-turn-helix transcriptional regulator [Dialister invisus]
MTISQNIKRRRQEVHMTLEEVAKIVGVSRQTIQRYESGIIASIPSDKIEKLAVALRTTPAYLMSGLLLQEDSTPYGTPPDLKDILKSGSILFDGVSHSISKEDGDLLANIFLTIANKKKEKKE